MTTGALWATRTVKVTPTRSKVSHALQFVEAMSYARAWYSERSSLRGRSVASGDAVVPWVYWTWWFMSWFLVGMGPWYCLLVAALDSLTSRRVNQMYLDQPCKASLWRGGLRAAGLRRASGRRMPVGNVEQDTSLDRVRPAGCQRRTYTLP